MMPGMDLLGDAAARADEVRGDGAVGHYGKEVCAERDGDLRE